MATMIERLKAEREKMKNKGRGNAEGFLKLPKDDEAEVRIRILPAKNWYDAGEEEADLFYKRFGVHWINGQKIICPHQTHGDKCPICETVWELNRSTDEDDLATAKEFRVKKRHWVNCVEVDKDGNIGESVKIFEFGIKLLENIQDWCCDEDYDDISDPVRGYTFRVMKKKVDGFPNYDSSKPVKNPSEVPEDVMKSLLEQAVEVHSVVDGQVKTYEEIQADFELGSGVEAEKEEPADSVDQDELLARINKKIKK